MDVLFVPLPNVTTLRTSSSAFHYFLSVYLAYREQVAKTNLLGLWSPGSAPDLAGDTVTRIPDTAHMVPQFPLRTNGESGWQGQKEVCLESLCYLVPRFRLWSDFWRVGEHENQGCVSFPGNRFKP